MVAKRAPLVPAGLVFTLAAFLFGLVAGRELPSGSYDLAIATACVAAAAFAGVRVAALRLSKRSVTGTGSATAIESRFERHVASRPRGPHRRRTFVRRRRLIV